MCVTRINVGLIMTAGVHSTSSRRLISGGLVIALELTGNEFVHYQRMADVPRLCVSLVSEAKMF